MAKLTEFKRALMKPPANFDINAMARHLGVSLEEAQRLHDKTMEEEVYLNNMYQVNIERHNDTKPPIIHLSIKRRDKKPIHDWRHLQRIKNMLTDPEFDAVEIYPAESRLIDTANQYHCWVIADRNVRIPVPLERAMAKPGPKRKSLAERLWSKVDLSGGPNACWFFKGARGGSNNEYGIIARGGDSSGQTPYYAHRVAYALANGLDPEDLPDDMEVRHSCDNPPCCNPMHLSLGTSSDNKQDAVAKGRMFWQRAKRDASTKQFLPEDAEDESDHTFHIWVFADKEFRFGLGFHQGRRVIYESGCGAVQRGEPK